MTVLLTIIHVLVCVFLTLVVLLQQGNKQGMGAAFGGSSSTVFGGRGANTFLQKLTAAAAGLFMVTSLTLSYLSSRTGSAFDDEVPAAEQTAAPDPSAPKTEAPVKEEKPAEPAAGQEAPPAMDPG
ncbi:MAG: preprotein translocase subunit SecG, partial [Myxococcota bacterium]